MSLHRFAALVEKSMRKPAPSKRRRRADRNRYLLEALNPVLFADQGLLAAFFFDTNLSALAFFRADTAFTDFNFSWANGASDIGITTDDNEFSARWTGNLTVGTSGTYGFEGQFSDGMRLKIDGQTVIGRWPTLAGDADENGVVDLSDLNAVLNNFGLTPATRLQGDLDGNGTVDSSDMNSVLNSFGEAWGASHYEWGEIELDSSVPHTFELEFFNHDGPAFLNLSMYVPESPGGTYGGSPTPITAGDVTLPKPIVVGMASTVSGTEGSTIAISATFGDPTGSGLSASVDWGDTTESMPDTNVALNHTNTYTGILSASHAYADDGTYSATLTLSGPTGTKTVPFTVNVANADPTGALTAPATAHVGDPVTLSFDDPQDAPGDADSLTYRFDLDGDGDYETNAGHGASFQTTFSTAGIHTVGGRITDKDGGYVDSTATINVGGAISTPGRVAIASASSSSITVQWPASQTGGNQFVLEYSTDPDFTSVTSVNVTGMSKSLTGLASSTEYFFRVAETNAGGLSSYSPVFSTVTPASGFRTSARPTTTQINLAWDAGGSTVGYVLQRRPLASYLNQNALSANGDRSGDVVEFEQVTELSPGSTSYSDAGLAPGADFEYRLIARADDGVEQTNPNAAQLFESTVPIAPTLTAVLGAYDYTGGNVFLSWSSNSNGYRPVIEVSVNGQNWYALTSFPNPVIDGQWTARDYEQPSAGAHENSWWSMHGDQAPKQYIDWQLAGRTIQYRVRVSSYRRWSEPSNIVTIQTPSLPNLGTRLPRVRWSQQGGTTARGVLAPLSESSGQTVKIGVTALGGSLQQSVFASLSIAGTATPGEDYATPPTGLVLPGNLGEVLVELPIYDDGSVERTEYVFLTIQPSSSYMIDTYGWPMTFAIADDDWVDVSVDSNNDDGLYAQASDSEDAIEDDPSQSGKVVAVNDGDADGDGVPDYADGYGLTGSAADQAGTVGNNFSQMSVQLPYGVDVFEAKIRFAYDGSDPAAVVPPAGDDTGFTLPASGTMRLWKKDGSVTRNPSGNLAAGGDYVSPQTPYSISNFFAYSAGHTIPKLYIEALKPSTASGDLRVQVEVDPDGDGPKGWVLADAVRLTALTSRLVEADEDGTGTHVATSFTSSNPRPSVTLTYTHIQNVHPSADGKMIYGDVYVEGTVTSAVADVTAGALGTIDSVDVYLGDGVLPIGTIASGSGMTVTKADYTPSFTKPYAYSGQFAKTFSNVPLQPGQNNVTVTASEKVYGAAGYASATIELHVSPAVPVLGAPDFSTSTFNVDPAVPAGHSDPGEFHRYLYQVVGPVNVLQQTPYIQTPFGARAVKQASDLKYYIAPNMQATYKASGAPSSDMFRLKNGDPQFVLLGNGMTELRYEYEKRTDHFVTIPFGVDNLPQQVKSGEQWDSLGVNSLVVPSAQAAVWAKYIRSLAGELKLSAEWKEAKGDVAFLEGALTAVPLGSAAKDINDGDVGWSTAKGAFVDAALTFTPLIMVRPIRTAGVVIATGQAIEKATVAEYSGLLTGGSGDIAATFGTATVGDGSFVVLSNPRIPSLSTGSLSAGSNVVTVSTDRAVFAAGEGEIFVEGFRSLTPAEVPIWKSVRPVTGYWDGAIIPKDFVVTASGGTEIFVTANASEHLVEPLAGISRPWARELYQRMVGEEMIRRINKWVELGYPFDGQLRIIDGVEMVIAPGQNGPLPALTHYYRP